MDIREDDDVEQKGGGGGGGGPGAAEAVVVVIGANDTDATAGDENVVRDGPMVICGWRLRFSILG